MLSLLVLMKVLKLYLRSLNPVDLSARLLFSISYLVS